MSLYEAVKDAANIARKANNIELYQKILDLQAQALDEQETKAILASRVRELEGELDQLKEQLSFSKSLTYDDRLQCYHVEGEGSAAGGYICSRCWDARKVAIRLRDYRNGYWGCPDCQSSIEAGRRG